MTQDEIIEMAREAGIIHPEMVAKHLVAFAKLVAEKEQDGECKKCKDGCPACDARKLQKEAHDLL